MRIITNIPIKIPLLLFKKRKEREQKINKEMVAKQQRNWRKNICKKKQKKNIKNG